MKTESVNLGSPDHNGTLGWLRFEYERNRSLINGAISIFLGLILWEIVNRIFDDPDALVGPYTVIVAFSQLVWEPDFWENVRFSATEGVYGFLMAATVGATVGLALAFSRTLDEMFSPILVGLYATPRAVVAPLFIIWFGLGIESKVGVIFVASVFPVIINTQAGIKNVDGEFRMLARAFNVPFWSMVWKIILPGSLPFLIAGLRLAYSRAVVTIMVAELFGSEAGVGYMIDRAAQTFNIPDMLVGICILTLWGILGNELLKFLERWATPYKKSMGVH